MSRREHDGGEPEALVELAARHRRRPAEKRQDSQSSFSSSDHGQSQAAVATPPSSPPLPEPAARPRRGRQRVPLSTDTVSGGEKPRPAKAERQLPEKPARAERAERAEQPERGRRDHASRVLPGKAEREPVARGERKRARREPAGDTARGRRALGRLGIWGLAACAAALAVVVLTFDAVNTVPHAMQVSSVRVGFLPGPQVPVAEVLRWIDRFPQHDQLRDPNAWQLGQLAEYLRKLPAVDQVSQVFLVHEPGHNGSMRRVMEIDLALRRPVMPTMLKTGEHAWLDAGGHVLPGILPGPKVRRPLVRDVEGADPAVISMAIELWQRLEGQLEGGLVTDLVLDDILDERGTRGLVLYTRMGNRLIIGRPEDQRYGITLETKARELVHAIRCQGDLTQVAMINVRFGQAFYTLHAPTPPPDRALAVRPPSSPGAPIKP